ncbi:hypothetical protein SKAU_G00128990 [Synaphobranchus kaupii]|uniref:Uncharacterized protein n=1 Tax=Synaphobranchus kaupii TaxID=118154 RepID=A0A9Q1J357_SYNKA|nr:hypothetical protein SKAU_G00128990 [Synaphobranchus kaupii]
MPTEVHKLAHTFAVANDVPACKSWAEKEMAATPVNIQAGFQASGIYPFNEEVFDDSDFAPSYVIARCLPDPSC